MPELNAEIKQRVDAQVATIHERDRDWPNVGCADLVSGDEETQADIARMRQGEAADGDAPAEGGDEEPIDPLAGVDPEGGLAPLETYVELSLNGQNFTDDKISFTYYGTLTPEEVQVLPPADGSAAKNPETD